MANFNLNKVILGGRLTADPELKTTPSGIAVTTFPMAVARRGSKNGESDFFNVTAWRQTAEFITRYFRKGSSICIMGMIQMRQWTDQAGQKHIAPEIVADEAYFVDKKNGRAGVCGGTRDGKAAGERYATVTSAELEELAADEELPF